MTKRMLIDAAHKEEVRVVVVEDERVEDFEVETTGKEQIKGNIYVGEVTRVEPSLQAAFINYGGNRNGFLAFSEIHPGYFDLPKEEKDALLAELEEIAARRKGKDKQREDMLEKEQEEKAAEKDAKNEESTETKPEDSSEEKKADTEATSNDTKEVEAKAETPAKKETPKADVTKDAQAEMPESLNGLTPEEMEEDARALAIASQMTTGELEGEDDSLTQTEQKPKLGRRRPRRHAKKNEEAGVCEDAPSADILKADEETPSEEATEEKKEKRQPIHRRYSIQDVLKEGQKILIQVNKEERGNKGAALSTYISLPGRYSVLMPNTPYAGGISRKITDFKERRALKQVISTLDIPDNMGLIVRTAGVGQSEENIKKDIDNLLNHWSRVEKHFENPKKVPQLLHEDGSLSIRAIRDFFNDEIDEVIIAGRKSYRSTKDYVKSLMPESAKRIKEHRAQTPIFCHYDVEDKINRLHTTRVNLPSGGYLIINPTEALVSIDVNSGKATQEKNIEETAIKTNLEAAEEVARQLRLRDLAGLVVIDFIDMEESKNERMVERTMRKAVRRDRARVQIANISNFGLMEMSRQRLRPSIGESTMQPCPHCNGIGMVQSLASAALMLLRSLENDNVRTKADRVVITTSDDLALYILNHKRELVKDIEKRYGFEIFLRGDDNYHAPDHRLEVIRVDNNGTEKRQIHEILLRENLDAEESRGKRKRSRKKKADAKDTNQQEKPQQKGKNKSDKQSDEPENVEAKVDSDENQDEPKKKGRVRRLRRPRRDRKENQDEQNVEAKSEEEAKEASNEDTPKDDKPRRTRRGGRRTKRNEDEPEATESKDEKSYDMTSAEEGKEDKPRRKRRSTKRSTSSKKDASDNNADADSNEEKKERKPRRTRRTRSDVKDKETKPAKGITVETISATGTTEVQNTEGASVTKAFQRWWSKKTS